jgi:hypothetical protein
MQITRAADLAASTSRGCSSSRAIDRTTEHAADQTRRRQRHSAKLVTLHQGRGDRPRRCACASARTIDTAKEQKAPATADRIWANHSACGGAAARMAST